MEDVVQGQDHAIEQWSHKIVLQKHIYLNETEQYKYKFFLIAEMYAVVCVLVNLIMIPGLIYYNKGQSYNTKNLVVMSISRLLVFQWILIVLKFI